MKRLLIKIILLYVVAAVTVTVVAVVVVAVVGIDVVGGVATLYFYVKNRPSFSTLLSPGTHKSLRPRICVVFQSGKY